MNKIEITYDSNAHIGNLSYRMIVSEDRPYALVSFENLGFGDITAIKLTAVGYNSFGDIVQVNGADSFFLIAQSLDIARNASAKDIKIVLPSREIHRLELSEYQICYADNTIVTYEGKNEVTFELEELSEDDSREGEELVALHETFDKLAKYLPVESADGWVCACGGYNHPSVQKCMRCRHDKGDVFQAMSSAGRRAAIERKKAVDERRRKESAEREAASKRARRQKRFAIAGVAVALVALLALSAPALLTIGRSTYSSADEMKSAVQGEYTYYSPSTGQALRQIAVSGDTVVYRWANLDDVETEVREWGYEDGTIETFETLIVTSEGDIKSDGDVYQRGGAPMQGKDSDASSETERSALSVSDVKVSSNSSYTICTGTVTNNGSNSYSYVEVKGSFKDSSGTTVDTDWTYAVGSEGLSPGESSTFRMSVPKNSEIESCSVSIMS